VEQHKYVHLTICVLSFQDLQFYVLGNSEKDLVDKDAFVRVHNFNEDAQSAHSETDPEDRLSQPRHSVTSIYVAGDSDVVSLTASQSSQSHRDDENDVCSNDGATKENESSTSVPSAKQCELKSTINEESVFERERSVHDVIDADESSQNIPYEGPQEDSNQTAAVVTEMTAKEGSKDGNSMNSLYDDGPQDRQEKPNRDDVPVIVKENNEGTTECTDSIRPLGSNQRKAKNLFFGVVNAKKLAHDQNITSRLNRLEKSLSDLMLHLPKTERINCQSTIPQPVEEMVSNITHRLSTVEQFLHGFNTDKMNIDEDPYSNEGECKRDESNDEVDKDSVVSQEWSVVKSDGGGDSSLEKVRSLVFHLNEREIRTEATIDELAKQITDLQNHICQDSCTKPESNNTADEMEAAVVKLSGDLQQQMSNILVSIESKVSIEEFNKETQLIRDVLDRCNSTPDSYVNVEQPVNEASFDDAKLSDLIMRVDDLAKKKVDESKLDQLMEQQGALQSLVECEVSKQNLHITNMSEKLNNELNAVRSLVDSQMSTVARIGDESCSRPNTDEGRIDMSGLDEMIQQATNSVRTSLEESFAKRLSELKSIEDELDDLVSQLADKPNQEQIDSMMRSLEANMSEYIGQNKELQMLVDNMKKGE
jgi:hypothetical protein